MEILWDLSDGGPSDLPFALPDTDNDGVALGPAAVFGAMRTLAQQPGAYPDVTTFLRHLVRTNLANGLTVKNLLLAGGHPESMLPLDDVSPWPIDIALGSTVGGKVDSLTNPAPSGGAPRPGNGRDAVQVYRVHVPTAMWLTAAAARVRQRRPERPDRRGPRAAQPARRPAGSQPQRDPGGTGGQLRGARLVHHLRA
jgi:hypothetical protein